MQGNGSIGLPAELQERVETFAKKRQEDPAGDQYFPLVYSSSTSRIRLQRSSMSEPRDLINFATSNYLCLGQRPRVVEAAKRALDRFGTGANGSPAMNGYCDVHNHLERGLADIHEMEDAALFPSGVSANIGVISSLLGPADVVLLDENAHGSLVLGARTAGAQIRFYKHFDYESLRSSLNILKKENRTVLLGVMGVFSMTGEVESVPKILELAREYNVLTLLDDAHALGVLGPRGVGSLEHFGLRPDAVTLHVGTLSKTLSGVGGYVAGPHPLINYIRYHAKTQLLSAGIPQATAAGCLEAVRILAEDGGRLSAELRAKGDLFRKLIRAQGLKVGGDGTAVVPVPMAEADLWKTSRALFERGYYVNAVAYPGVPRGQERLRFTVTVEHDDRDLEAAAKALGESFSGRQA